MDLSELVQPLLACLQDKVSATRQAAEKVMTFVVHQVGFNAVKAEISNLPKAVQLQLTPIIEKCREHSHGAGRQDAAAMDEDVPEQKVPMKAAKPVAGASRKAGPTSSIRASSSAENNVDESRDIKKLNLKKVSGDEDGSER